MAAGANLEGTNGLVTGGVLFIMVVVSMMVETFLHHFDHFLAHRDYSGLVLALEKAKVRTLGAGRAAQPARPTREALLTKRPRRRPHAGRTHAPRLRVVRALDD